MNWLLNDLNKWDGSGTPNVIKINISHQNLKHFPKKIFLLENLVELECFGNRIKSIPDDILKLKNLRKFYYETGKIKQMSDNVYNFINRNGFVRSLDNENGQLVISDGIMKIKSDVTHEQLNELMDSENHFAHSNIMKSNNVSIMVDNDIIMHSMISHIRDEMGDSYTFDKYRVLVKNALSEQCNEKLTNAYLKKYIDKGRIPCGAESYDDDIIVENIECENSQFGFI